MNAAPASASAGMPAPMSEPARLAGVFWDPKPVFQDLAQRPRWWVPLILITLLAVVQIYAFSRIVGWDTFLRHELQTNPRTQQLPAEQMELIIQQQGKFAGIMGYAGAALATAISWLLIAGILLLVLRTVAGADLNFRRAFSVTAYSWLPFGLYQLLALIVLLFANPADYDLRNPLPFNPGWFLSSSDTSGWMKSVAGSLDLFSFWVMALLALGFSVAARKIRFGKSFAMVFSVWFAYVLLKTGWAAIFG